MSPEQSESRILVIEDSAPLAEVVGEILAEVGALVTLAYSGAEGLRVARASRPDLVLIDLGLPDVNGMWICREVLGMQGPRVIVMTGLDDADTAEAALELGADDYVRKPFHLNELRARVRAVLRRSGREGPRLLRVGRLALDEERCQVMVDGVEVALSATELRLLAFLLRHPGWVFSKERLLDALWPDDRDAHVVQMHLSNLRRKIEPDPVRPQFLVTVKGLGYRLDPGGAGVGGARHEPA
jgi:DNA-binding response OmpR family regulator